MMSDLDQMCTHLDMIKPKMLDALKVVLAIFNRRVDEKRVKSAKDKRHYMINVSPSKARLSHLKLL